MDQRHFDECSIELFIFKIMYSLKYFDVSNVVVYLSIGDPQNVSITFRENKVCLHTRLYTFLFVTNSRINHSTK